MSLHWAPNLKDATRTRCGKTVGQVLGEDDDVTSCPALDFFQIVDRCHPCVDGIKASVRRTDRKSDKRSGDEEARRQSRPDDQT